MRSVLVTQARRDVSRASRRATAISDDVVANRQVSVVNRRVSAISSLIASTVAAVVITGILATSVLADATPIQLVLLYMPHVSNTGTTTASGIAELVMPEGEVRITAADLPRLDSDKQYVAWVVNTETNELQRLAAFNTAESTSAVHYESVLADAIPNHHWSLLLITVEDTALPSRPSSQHSIAGVFPSPDNSPLPVALPNTGGEPAVSTQPFGVGQANWVSNPGLAPLTLGLGAAAGYVIGRRCAPPDPLTTDF